MDLQSLNNRVNISFLQKKRDISGRYFNILAT